MKKLKSKAISHKLITIVGPTASGKSDLAVKIARKFNGEVISADSRQVYKGMDIGAGKITKREMRGIPHHLLDIASPKKRFSVLEYQKLARRAIDKIFKKGKIPVLCGGTGFYIQAIIDGIILPKVKPDWELRKKLNKKTAEELFIRLKKLDPKRANSIDKKNKRRLIRALEIIIKTKKPVQELKKQPLPYPVLLIGIKKSSEDLKKLIAKRLVKRLRRGMVSEVKKLKNSGVSWKRLEEFGLEYRFIAQYLQKKINCWEMAESIQKESEQFARRQMTWFSTKDDYALDGKNNKRINWIKNYGQAEKLIRNFLKNK